MNKNNNIFVIGIAVLIAGAIGFMIYDDSKNKVSAPAVDQHGHPLANNVSAASLQELLDKPAPNFTLADKDGKIYSLNELRGKNIILFFNEGLMCYPACWNQIVSLAKEERFKSSETIALSVVVDPPKNWQKAIEKMPELAEATVVFDKDAAISKQFGMLTTASSMHYGSLPGHTFVLIDKNGVIKHIFDDPNMGIHNEQLVAELNKLN